ncbi:MAG: rhodanese-like domain-containing protein [Chromatiales bacterium]|nr:rhodanese-like domain-containing protein [Gammaproteobacteria bacterium]
MRKRFNDLIAEQSKTVDEIFPWDLAEELSARGNLLLLDIRCPYEFDGGHIRDSLIVPRGILETACDYGYDETVPELVTARDKRVVVICRSGNRSILAAYTLKQMGFDDIVSLKTGLRGWNDYDQPLVNNAGDPVDPDAADAFFSPEITPEQLGPAH